MTDKKIKEIRDHLNEQIGKNAHNSLIAGNSSAGKFYEGKEKALTQVRDWLNKRYFGEE